MSLKKDLAAKRNNRQFDNYLSFNNSKTVLSRKIHGKDWYTLHDNNREYVVTIIDIDFLSSSLNAHAITYIHMEK